MVFLVFAVHILCVIMLHMFSNASRQMGCMSMGFAVERHIVTDLLTAFLGSSLINTFQRATVEDVSHWTNVIAHC
jgi:hypothetical protein